MDDPKHDPSQDLQRALIIGAAAALYVILPPPLRSAAHLGGLIGLAAGVAAALVRRRLAATKPTWLRTALQVPPFAVGGAAGFTAMMWFAQHLPLWLHAVTSHIG
ncbi:MAG TPA: hypothetical protein VL426_08050 [Candidatus Binatia bacterium]|jgi:hypothetical protein|nr:hypothetical protein [Candidatus Binatia bacterium]